MAKTMNEKITAVEQEIERLKKRRSELMQTRKTVEKRNRTDRLCKRGGYLEKMLPDITVLTDEQFETFIRKTLQTGFAEKVLKQLLSSAPVTGDAPKPAQRKEARDNAQNAANSSTAEVAR